MNSQDPEGFNKLIKSLKHRCSELYIDASMINEIGMIKSSIKYIDTRVDVNEVLRLKPFLFYLGYEIDPFDTDSKILENIKRFQRNNGLYDDGFIANVGQRRTLSTMQKLAENSKYLPLNIESSFNSIFSAPFERDKRQYFTEWFSTGIFINEHIPFFTTENLFSFTNDSAKIEINTKAEHIYILYTGAWIYSTRGELINLTIYFTDGSKTTLNETIYDWTWHKNDENAVTCFSAISDNSETIANIYVLKVAIKNNDKIIDYLEINDIENLYMSIISVTINK